MTIAIKLGIPNINHPKRRTVEFSVLCLCLLIVTWLSISIGASNVDLLAPISALFTNESNASQQANITHNIIINLRLPRVLMALLVGAALAVSGASLQGLCRNPLADPSLLGIGGLTWPLCGCLSRFSGGCHRHVHGL